MQESRVRLTAGRVADFVCPPGKTQSFLWDTDAPSLALRVTPKGRKTYVFEGRLKGATIRISIGGLNHTITEARSEANRLRTLGALEGPGGDRTDCAGFELPPKRDGLFRGDGQVAEIH